ncbi:hypothetical protein [Actinoplanes sp. M2I2]|uniref:hypothetical protein n=1 Tax=Actinoplanes sp. M2I2 TaxID=1734444 RepID=UPI00202059CE|nr:hypothetical protein [Actinoplanes sp. M2I2]
MIENRDDLDRLAVLDPARGLEPTALQWARSEAAVERGMAGRHTSPARRRWTVAGASAAVASLIAFVAVPVLAPGSAIASWTATPTARTGEQVLPQAEMCGAGDVGGSSATVKPSDVILAEQRGDMTMLIMRKTGGMVVECLSVGDDRFASMTLIDEKDVVPPPSGTLTLETRSSTGDDDMWSNIVGLAGPGITAVDLRLDDGATVHASVRGGWWGAWWPGPEGGEGGDAFTVVVHTAQGTTNLRPSQLR